MKKPKINGLTATLAALLVAGLAFGAAAPPMRFTGIQFGQNDTSAWVTQYGAKGDGTTDDTSAIQSALTAVANAGGGSVYLPAGTYKISGVTIGDKVALVGAGAKKSVLVSSNDNVTLITSNGGSGWNQGIAIKDLELKSNSPANTNVVGMNLTKVQFSTVENVYTESLTWIARLTQCESVSLNKIKTYTVNNGVYAKQVVNSVFSDSSLLGSAPANGYCAQIDSNCDGFEMSSVNCDHSGIQMINSVGGSANEPMSTIFVDTQVGAFAGDSGWDLQAGSGTQISNCWSGSNTGHGIHIRSGQTDGVWISNTRVLGNAQHGIFAEAGNWSFIGGEIVNNSTSSSGSYDGVNVAARLSHWMVKGAQIGQYGAWNNTQRYGVNIGNADDDFIVEGNLFGPNVTANVNSSGLGSNASIVVRNGFQTGIQASTINTYGGASTGNLQANGSMAMQWNSTGIYPPGDNSASCGSVGTRWSNLFAVTAGTAGSAATAGATLQNSGTFIERGFYWNGSASTLVDVQAVNVVDSTTPTNHWKVSVGGNEVWDLTSGGAAASRVGSSIASATTIAPTAAITHVTGTTTIQTITAPPTFANSGMGGCIVLIFDGVAPWNAAGNISVAGTPSTAGTSVTFCYDSATSKFYPSRTS